jgi:hypothetical protein
MSAAVLRYSAASQKSLIFRGKLRPKIRRKVFCAGIKKRNIHANEKRPAFARV